MVLFVFIGGGVIGCEYACMFAALGVRVSIVEKSEKIVGGMDSEISISLKSRLKTHNISIVWAQKKKWENHSIRKEDTMQNEMNDSDRIAWIWLVIDSPIVQTKK